MSDRCRNNVQRYIKHVRASIIVSESAACPAAEIQLEIANESTSRFASGHPLPFPASFREEAGGVRARAAERADRLCAVASSPTIKLRQVSARAACVGRIFIAALASAAIKRVARCAFV